MFACCNLLLACFWQVSSRQVLLNEHDLLAGDLPFLSPGFLTIGRHKLDLIKTLLSYKVNLVISDVDTGLWSLP